MLTAASHRHGQWSRRGILAGLGCAICNAALAQTAAEWSYEGATGPENWGTLSPDYAACGIGAEQSPIDLVQTVPADAADVAFFWAASPSGKALNNGETVQANLTDGGHIMIGEIRYDLLQYHFHSPAEHTAEGMRHEAEIHFVHRAESGALAVVGVLLTGGGTSGAFDTLLAAAPLEEGDAPLGPTEPASFLPQDRSYFRYAGSLTTPPCSEIVLWTVMQTTGAVSDAAIATFRSRFTPNARPLQLVNRRFVLRE